MPLGCEDPEGLKKYECARMALESRSILVEHAVPLVCASWLVHQDVQHHRNDQQKAHNQDTDQDLPDAAGQQPHGAHGCERHDERNDESLEHVKTSAQQAGQRPHASRCHFSA